MWYTRHVLLLAFCLLGAAGGWHVMSGSGDQVRAQDSSQAQARGSGILDGTTYSGPAAPSGKTENWVFVDGVFQSSLCAATCNHASVPYFARNTGKAIEFVAESRCLDNNSKFAWHGVIQNGRAEGTVTWTMSRWYRTVVKEFEFEGSLVDTATKTVNMKSMLEPRPRQE